MICPHCGVAIANQNDLPGFRQLAKGWAVRACQMRADRAVKANQLARMTIDLDRLIFAARAVVREAGMAITDANAITVERRIEDMEEILSFYDIEAVS